MYATKLSPGKGLDLLLLSFSQAIKDSSGLKLQIVGGGDVEKYKRMAQKLGIEKHVKFMGLIDRTEVMRMRQESLLEVVPSIYPESFGRAALEALANGLPVVVSDRGGLTDIVQDGVTGFVVEPTREKLVRAIIKGVRRNNFLRENIRNNFEKLRFKFEILPIRRHISLYKNLI